MADLKKYIVIEADSILELEDRVETAIDQGFIPTGGVAIIWYPTHSQYDPHDIERVFDYSQAMVRKDVL